MDEMNSNCLGAKLITIDIIKGLHSASCNHHNDENLNEATLKIIIGCQIAGSVNALNSYAIICV